MSPEATYLKAILAMLARQYFPPDDIIKIISPKAQGEKQIAAYNLCDGTRTQAEIAKKTGIDTGNLSRTITRWEQAGILLKVTSGEDTVPVHLYPIVKG